MAFSPYQRPCFQQCRPPLSRAQRARMMGCDKWHKSTSRPRFWRAPHRSAPLLQSTFTISRNHSLAFMLHPPTDDHVHVNGMISSLLQ